MANPAKSLLEDVLTRGRADGLFREDVDAIDVHLVISAFCVFQVANQHTFGFLFGRDLQSPAERRRLRPMIGDIVVSWLTK
jgi:Tetracyclin repressor-like, C-terminal domain